MATKTIVQAEGIPVEVRDAVSTILTWGVNVLMDRMERR